MRYRVVSVRLFSFLFIFSALFSLTPLAYAEDDPAPEELSIINSKELTGLIETFMGERNISKANFSLGFCYTATGDTWYYNEGAWFYPASMYKVPLIMLLSEQVKSGELTQETELYGMTVAGIEELILTYSNNDWAHNIRTYLGGDAVWRQEAKKYSPMADSEYDPDYMQYCYFNSRYITDVMYTLFQSPDSYPNVIDCLLAAEPEHYFRLSMEGQYPIAQKYGSFDDDLGNSFRHTTGIVYTDNPCVITVMTKNISGWEQIIADAAKLLTDYSLKLDSRLAAHRSELEAQEAEQQRIKEDEEAQAQREAMEAERRKAESEAAQQAIREQTALQDARHELAVKLIALAAGLIIAAVIISCIVRKARRKARDARYAEYSRRYEAEQRAAQGVRDSERYYRRH